MSPVEQEGDVTEENGGLAVPAVFLTTDPSETQLGYKFKYWTSTQFWGNDSAAAFIFALYDTRVYENRVFDKPVADTYMVRCVHDLSNYAEPFILSFDAQSETIFADQKAGEVAITLKKRNGSDADLAEWDNVYRISPPIGEGTSGIEYSFDL